MVIHPRGRGCQRIAVITDQVRGGTVENDGQSAREAIVSQFVHPRAFHKTEKAGRVTYNIDLFFGEILLDNGFQADLAAQRITVGPIVTVDDNGAVVPDGL